MTRRRQDWNPDDESLALLKRVDDIIHSPAYRRFWPLTVRQIHYALFGRGFTKNTPKQYKKLINLLVRGRLSGRIPWRAIDDTHRDVLDSSFYDGAEEYIRSEFDNFMKGFSHSKSKDQPVALECWVEKDAVARIVHEIAEEFHLPTVIARGYSSVSFVHKLAVRATERFNDGRATKILYVGDLDPSGVHMLPAMFETLHEEMDVPHEAISYERVALTREQVRKYKLPQSPDALKDDAWQREHGDPKKTKGDPRAEAYKRVYGNLAVELDALEPEQLQDLMRSAIETHTDFDVIAETERRERRDQKRVDAIRKELEAPLNRAMKKHLK